jgi:hypothetical protein
MSYIDANTTFDQLFDNHRSDQSDGGYVASLHSAIQQEITYRSLLADVAIILLRAIHLYRISGFCAYLHYGGRGMLVHQHGMECNHWQSEINGLIAAGCRARAEWWATVYSILNRHFIGWTINSDCYE